MYRITSLIILFTSAFSLFSQQHYITGFLSDSTMDHASVSLFILDTGNGDTIARYNESKSYSQASVMKLVTTAAAIELLGPDYTFSTGIGYTGKLKKGILTGDIIIKGGGDPTLGSEQFGEHYGNFLDNWAEQLKTVGIRKVTGRVISDDSRYDYQPVPPGWNWEDIGNYYGAGVFGLSIFDNTLKIHFRTGASDSVPLITGTEPAGSGTEYVNYLISSGSDDRGVVYSAPYGRKGWISGSIPVDSADFVLRASITDPPLMAATILDEKLRPAGIRIKGKPSTVRVNDLTGSGEFTLVSETISPSLSSIIEVLNHESVNLYAEHLVKELGKVFKGEGTTAAGIEVITQFLDSMGVETSGMFIEDGSGLSPQNALSSAGVATLLYLMKTRGEQYDSFYNSLPEAGKDGTLRNYFRDPVFESSMRAKSGTLMRVKSYAGYLITRSGKELAFSIIVNNFTGTSSYLISRIGILLKEVILYE